MKKLLLAGLFLLAPSSLTMAQATLTADVDTVEQPSCIIISNNLRYRMRDATVNNEVSDLQDFLNMKGYLSSGPTGYFGSATFNAVKKFQKASGFAPTGYVGPLTRAKIKAMMCRNISTISSKSTVQTSSSVAQNQNGASPISQPATAVSGLKSNFFRGDAIAQDILSGHPFSIKDAINQDASLSTNSFALKFLNGMRQVGYTDVSSLYTVTESVPLRWLHKFQRVNNLSQGDAIGANELSKLDNLLYVREITDSSLTTLLPQTSIAPSSSFEPSSTHIAALLTNAFQVLPQSIFKWNTKNIADYFSMQGTGGDTSGVGGVRSSARGLCFLNYFSFSDNLCTFTNTTVLPGSRMDDFDFSHFILHEYAHYIDGALYFMGEEGTSRGAISTEEFAKISYDTSVNCNPNSSWRFFRIKNPSNIRNEFVTNYAQGWTANTGDENCKSSVEDFAESFAMYIMQGNTFRKLAETKSVIAQKYNWLKNNVFNGKEYFTGNANNIPAVDQALSAPYMFMFPLPSFMDYMTIDRNFVWDYKF